jgi:sugar (pentulose or hexulose) kinase
MSQAESKNSEVILAIDAGTQSMRAAFVDLSGHILDIVKIPIQPCSAPQPGWAEQRPEYYWETFCGACRALFAKSPELKQRVQGVAVTTQRSTLVDVDKNGMPLRPAIVWLDERKAQAGKTIPGMLRPLLKLLKYDELVEGVVRDCEASWIRQNQPDIWERTHKHLFLSGWFAYRLTGEFIDSSGNIIGYVPFNIKKAQWAHRFDPSCRLFPIEREKLPALVKPAGLLGNITAQACGETGIPQGLPVIAAANDKACEIIGAGCAAPDTACVSFGTISTINTQNSKYVELKPFWPPYPSAVPDSWYTEVAVLRGAWMITWFKEEFGLQEQLEAADKGVTPEELLDRLIEDLPPASMGLVLQPYWTPAPDKAKCARGSIIGFCDTHKRAHVYRAILEGIVFALKEGAQLTEKKNKTPISSLRVSGGGSQSDSVMQICADIFALPAQRPHTHETSLVGAAIDAAVGLKYFPDFPQAIKGMTRAGKVFEPMPGNAGIYKELFERVYLKMYKRLLPLFREIQDITG